MSLKVVAQHAFDWYFNLFWVSLFHHCPVAFLLRIDRLQSATRRPLPSTRHDDDKAMDETAPGTIHPLLSAVIFWCHGGRFSVIPT
ncbi:hypothetical protein BS50DRAFT_571974 [Corynespora cassiicola Philippines]|uniref:Uncharacterized protein n=1 Tax=Corynespora cassiicola Philippines TaxID=1448308 RepID=A0A2T2NTR8_CORCC|nr:hypothetical protein BS50DRAFT_571974 [Corynespora cassiicola Philippines]